MIDSVTDSTTGAILERTGRPARVMYTLCRVGGKKWWATDAAETGMELR